jgi:[protein-PII] uridylyltransferase
VSEAIYLPITELGEIYALLDELPLAVDRDHFVRFVRGFPRRYLLNTARLEIVKHYLLGETLGKRSVISSLYPQDGAWKLVLIALDRERLFAKIAGTLACYRLDIKGAEAFANANGIALDTFLLSDPGGHLKHSSSRDTLLHLAEEIVSGVRSVEDLLGEHRDELPFADYDPLQVRFDNETHPKATQLLLKCRDHLGLAYLLSDRISKVGCSIEMAYIETVGDFSEENYYLTCEGRKLSEEQQVHLQEALMRKDVP